MTLLSKKAYLLKHPPTDPVRYKGQEPDEPYQAEEFTCLGRHADAGVLPADATCIE